MMTTTIKLAIALAALVLLLAILGPSACSKINSLKQQSKVDRGQAGAAQNSAVDAIETQGNVFERERALDVTVANSIEEVRNAKGAEQKADPAVTAAGRRGLCSLPAFRNDPECRVREPSSK